MVLTKEDRSGDSCLLASHFMDWRRILAVQDGRSSFSLELNGIGAENNVPVGILEIKLSLIPKLSKVMVIINVGKTVLLMFAVYVIRKIPCVQYTTHIIFSCV